MKTPFRLACTACFLSLLLGCGASTPSNVAKSANAGNVTATQDAPPPPPVSSANLRAEQNASAEAFKQKYDGKEVTVWGKFEQVDHAVVDTVVYFSQDPGANSSRAPIECTLNRDEVAKFDSLKLTKGTLIRVKGLMRVTSMALELKKCSLVKQGPSADSND